MKIISVVLTKSSDRLSNLLWLLSGFGYTHASISLDDKCEKMYSFNFRGFCSETGGMFHKRGVKAQFGCVL